jgi:hypothetical protein
MHFVLFKIKGISEAECYETTILFITHSFLSVKLTTRFHLVVKMRMGGAIPPLPTRVHGVVLN